MEQSTSPDTPLVSCIIPSYNHEKYLGNCIRSLISQRYNNLELLIIDDGSTDQSRAVIEKYRSDCEARFNRFEVIYQKNKGLPATLNVALAWAHGEYFSTIASDDVAFSDKISNLLPYFTSEKIAAVTGGYIEINDDGKEIRKFVPPMGLWNFEDVLQKKAKIYAPTAIIKTSILRSIDGYWTDIPIEDRAMWLRLTHLGYLICSTSNVVAYYRRHSNNLSQDTIKMIEGRMRIYDRFEPHPLISRMRAKDLYGAAKDIATSDKSLARSYLIQAILINPLSLFTSAALQGIVHSIRK